jgi:deoxycytidylate deaminase
MIINAGLVRVVYAGTYPDANARAFLSQAGVALVHVDITLARPAELPTPDR